MVLSGAEMTTLWRQILGYDTPRRDCSIERDDGIDVDSLILTHINQWYEHLLFTAPIHWLPVSDVSNLTQASADAEGVVTLILPEHSVRPVEVMLQGWTQPVCEFLQPTDDKAKMQSSIWLRGGMECPVAIAYDHRLILYSTTPGATPVVQTARTVVRPPADSYVFGTEALSTIPQFGASL